MTAAQERKWYMSWSATKLHAAPPDSEWSEKGLCIESTTSLCGQEIYTSPPHEVGRAELKKGNLQKCKRCLKKIEKEAE